MRKFKLIKEYPGSPNLNTIVVDTNINNGAKDSYFSENWGKIGLAFKIGKQHDCENNPEFWEEIFDKNYEILLLKANDKHINSPGKIKEIWRSDYNTDYWYIYSVKRISDGKIFTIGDKVQDSLTDKLTNYAVQEITYFYPGEKIICQAKSGTTMPLNTIRHTSFLFKTEDGVEIFEGDSVWGFYTGYGYVFEEKDLERAKIEQWLKFSTKEKAEKYILLNKPCLSINDIRNCINQTEIDIDNEHELNYQLNELVKVKLYGNK